MLCAYLLLVPSSALERNVASKVRPPVALYTDPSTPGQQVEIQRGEFRAAGTDDVSIEFHRPFAVAPSVEVVDIYHNMDKPEVISSGVTSFQATFSRGSYSPSNERAYYVWIATGVPLKRIDEDTDARPAAV